MILVLIGYLSFYFDLENFTDRAMIVLTTMLVIATITASIQAVIIIISLNITHYHIVCYMNNHGIIYIFNYSNYRIYP